MVVAELIEHLKTLPPETEVRAWIDDYVWDGLIFRPIELDDLYHDEEHGVFHIG